MEEYDVIVIGAGFGGPVAAKKCSDAGLKVLMIERSENVGEKVISGLTIPFYGFLFGPDFIRNGNPPFERPTDGIINYIIKDIDKGDIEIEDSLIVPKPLSPIIAFGYNTYCKEFIEWEVKVAKDSGVELRTSTTVRDVIKEDGSIIGVITDQKEELRAKIVIDAEGSQGLIAIKAGVREKYPPETISLADTYDYTMPKEQIDKILGYTEIFVWGWDEQKIAPPLGHGNGLMVWPYRNSLHFMQDQCLSLDGKEVPNLKKLFKIYHKNITSKLEWWEKRVAPYIKLRAHIWEGFEIYVGLDDNLRKKPMITDGMILIGDAAGLESTELCDGVPAAWFSAEIAAEVVIEAIRAGDFSKSFLKKYEERIRTHEIIQWSISGRNRYDLRDAQENHDEKLLRKHVHDGWGLGSLSHFTGPFLKYLLNWIKDKPSAFEDWFKMFFRYYYNWLHENYGYSKDWKIRYKKIGKSRKFENLFKLTTKLIGNISRIAHLMTRLFSGLLGSIAGSVNKIIGGLLPLIEPIFLKIRDNTDPLTSKYSDKLISLIENSNPRIYDTKMEKELN